jgi:serine protease Do
VIKKDFPVYKTTYENVSPLDGFTISLPRQTQVGTEKKVVGSGSGFIVSSDGYIVTNRHVVEDTDATYTVTLANGKEYAGTVLARDAVLDIAIVKIAGSGFSKLELGDSDSLKLGQSVIAIGNALGQFQNTVSVGIISGLSRSIVASGGGSSELLDKVIQTDAAINPGNSGGPLLDLDGRAVGVNVAVAQGSQSIGFSIPINSIKSIISSVRTTGSIVRPYLGVRYADVTADIAASKGLSVNYGVLVTKGDDGSAAVDPGSPADKAGIVENDVILSFDGVNMDEKHDLAFLIRGKKVGQSVTLGVLRNNKEIELHATLAKAKAQ